MTANLLAIEAELVQRLQQRLAPLRPAVHVLTAADLADVTEEKQLCPAVHVIYQGYTPTESRADGRAVRIEQTWLAVVAVRNARAVQSGAAARAEAGALAQQVLLALQGWQPADATKPLQLASAPNAGYSAGYQYVPLAFTAELICRTTPN